MSANFDHCSMTTLHTQIYRVSIGFRSSSVIPLVGSETLPIIHGLPTLESAALHSGRLLLMSLLKHDSSRATPCLVKGRMVPFLLKTLSLHLVVRLRILGLQTRNLTKALISDGNLDCLPAGVPVTATPTIGHYSAIPNVDANDIA